MLPDNLPRGRLSWKRRRSLLSFIMAPRHLNFTSNSQHSRQALGHIDTEKSYKKVWKLLPKKTVCIIRTDAKQTSIHRFGIILKERVWRNIKGKQMFFLSILINNVYDNINYVLNVYQSVFVVVKPVCRVDCPIRITMSLLELIWVSRADYTKKKFPRNACNLWTQLSQHAVKTMTPLKHRIIQFGSFI